MYIDMANLTTNVPCFKDDFKNITESFITHYSFVKYSDRDLNVRKVVCNQLIICVVLCIAIF